MNSAKPSSFEKPHRRPRALSEQAPRPRAAARSSTVAPPTASPAVGFCWPDPQLHVAAQMFEWKVTKTRQPAAPRRRGPRLVRRQASAELAGWLQAHQRGTEHHGKATLLHCHDAVSCVTDGYFGDPPKPPLCCNDRVRWHGARGGPRRARCRGGGTLIASSSRLVPYPPPVRPPGPHQTSGGRGQIGCF